MTALQRTGRSISARELRAVLGTQALTGKTIAVAGGEWRQERGNRWRFWKGAVAGAAPAADGEPSRRPWWSD